MQGTSDTLSYSEENTTTFDNKATFGLDFFQQLELLMTTEVGPLWPGKGPEC